MKQRFFTPVLDQESGQKNKIRFTNIITKNCNILGVKIGLKRSAKQINKEE